VIREGAVGEQFDPAVQRKDELDDVVDGVVEDARRGRVLCWLQ